MPINPSPAVLRAGQLLWLMARHPSESYSVSELARAVDIPRATCDSILQALAEHGLVVRREPGLRYELGAFCIALGDVTRVSNPTLSAASREAEELAQKLGACVAVSARAGTQTRVMSVSDWGPPLGMRPRPGQSMPLVPPFGAVLVAWSEADSAAWLARADDAVASGQTRAWEQALQTIRARGYSITVARGNIPDFATAFSLMESAPDMGAARRQQEELVDLMQHTEYLVLVPELDDGVSVRMTQVSAPVLDVAGRVVAALMLLGPNYDLTSREMHALGRQVAEAAQRASKAASGGATSS
ncbi:IclR family transcriptional regulator [Candidatus Frankia nodulisporulans]|uniref:IclR family transcriptional regulator n=1 Tax=Candidatus Frankia nodulisporulans TaxID=2060052 RepID=UPI0013D0F225|nr:helix-turn-helix domain-containing protein [Candidatus Frankia nodulisporulans]